MNLAICKQGNKRQESLRKGDKVVTSVLRVLLIIGGGIAAYKCLELIRKLREAGLSVTPVMTRAAQQFVTPLSVAALCGEPVRIEIFDPHEEARMDHIQLSRQSDLVAVVPATADLLAKMANGLADDLASTVLLATDKPVLIAPAMNVRMWQHAATQHNVETLRRHGVHFVGPENGPMACGETGPGRMSEPQRIVSAICHFPSQRLLCGRRILVTSGPTWEPVDPVRVIANRSSGRQGTEIAKALLARGAEVVFVTGPASVAPPPHAQIVAVETADEMLHATRTALPVDAAVFAAAVTDWKADAVRESKIRKSESALPDLKLRVNPDILAEISQLTEARPSLVIGFAAETENVIENAIGKLRQKGCDWIVANDVSVGSGILGGDENQPVIITGNGENQLPRQSKAEFAGHLADLIASELLAQ